MSSSILDSKPNYISIAGHTLVNSNNKNEQLFQAIIEAFQNCEDCKNKVKSAFAAQDFAGQKGLDNVHTGTNKL
jgi:hypothetical protein